MSTEQKKKCCDGCKNGQLGTNKLCKARIMAGKLTKNIETLKTE